MNKHDLDTTTERIVSNIKNYHKKDKMKSVSKIMKIMFWVLTSILIILSIAVIIVSSVLLITIKP